MALQSPTRAITLEEFEQIAQLSIYDDKLLELVDGALVTMPKPGGRHGEITMEIGRLLANYVREHRLGRVTAAETGFFLGQTDAGRDIVRGLDVAFIDAARAPQPLASGIVRIAPNLAVEVISPGNSVDDIDDKVQELLNAGTPLIWLILPEARRIIVWTNEGAIRLNEQDTLTGGDVLPGFSVRVSDLFDI